MSLSECFEVNYTNSNESSQSNRFLLKLTKSFANQISDPSVVTNLQITFKDSNHAMLKCGCETFDMRISDTKLTELFSESTSDEPDSHSILFYNGPLAGRCVLSAASKPSSISKTQAKQYVEKNISVGVISAEELLSGQNCNDRKQIKRKAVEVENPKPTNKRKTSLRYPWVVVKEISTDIRISYEAICRLFSGIKLLGVYALPDCEDKKPSQQYSLFIECHHVFGAEAAISMSGEAIDAVDHHGESIKFTIDVTECHHNFDIMYAKGYGYALSNDYQFYQDAVKLFEKYLPAKYLSFDELSRFMVDRSTCMSPDLINSNENLDRIAMINGMSIKQTQKQIPKLHENRISELQVDNAFQHGIGAYCYQASDEDCDTESARVNSEVIELKILLIRLNLNMQLEAKIKSYVIERLQRLISMYNLMSIS